MACVALGESVSRAGNWAFSRGNVGLGQERYFLIVSAGARHGWTRLATCPLNLAQIHVQ